MQGLVQWMQGWLGLRQRGDRSDQHLKQDIMSYLEDLEDFQEIQDTMKNKPS